jgi:hypothetical protein
MTEKAITYQTNIMNPLPKCVYLILTEINIFAYEVINVNRYHNFIPKFPFGYFRFFYFPENHFLLPQP